MSRPASILGFFPSKLPFFVFLIPFLAIFIPNKIIFRTSEQRELTFLKNANLSYDALNVLRFLMGRSMDRGFTSMRVREIADEMHMCESKASASIKELKASGFIMSVFDRDNSKSVFILLSAAFMPLLYRSGIEIADNYEGLLGNIYLSICEEFHRRFPLAGSLENFRIKRAEEEALRDKAIREGGSRGGKTTARKKAALKGDSTNQQEAHDTTSLSGDTGQPCTDTGPSYINIKKQEKTPPPPNSSATTETIHESNETVGDNSLSSPEKPIKTPTWVDEFERLADRRQPSFPDEKPIYTLSSDGIPVFNEDPRLSDAQNATRYSDFQKLKALAKENAIKQLANPRRVNFKKEEKQAEESTQSRNTSARESASSSLDEEARAYARENGMPEDVVLEVYRQIPEDMRRDDLLKFLKKYPKMSAYLHALCQEWRRLFRNGELPSREDLLWSVDAHIEHKWNLDTPQYIPDAISYLRNKMWIYAREQWKPRAKAATVTAAPSYERTNEEQARFNKASGVIDRLKEHFHIEVTGQIYGALYAARIGAAEKLINWLDELSTFTGTLSEWLHSIKARQFASNSAFSV